MKIRRSYAPVAVPGGYVVCAQEPARRARSPYAKKQPKPARFFTDLYGLWMRSVASLSPMSKTAAEGLCDRYSEEDRNTRS